MKITSNKVIAAAVMLVVLAAAFWWGGNAPGLRGWPPGPSPEVQPSSSTATPPSGAAAPSNLADTPIPGDTFSDPLNAPKPTQPLSSEPDLSAPSGPSAGTESRPGGTEGGLSTQEKLDLAKELAGGESSASVAEGDTSYSQQQGMAIDPVTGKDKYLTDPVPQGKPVPVDPQNVTISDTPLTCTLSVRCDTILENMDWLDKEKVELVPADGIIFPATKVPFYEGESVFNVLLREMKKAKIHLEFVNTPIYNSAYIEGINNLYEFDCGELSGWMYKVNDWFPNYGCSRYQLKEGDVVEWVYTCDLGVDVGGYYAVGGE